jgi:hypothetical protein
VRAAPAARLSRTAAGRAIRGAELVGALTERLRYSGPAPCPPAPLCDAGGRRRTQDETFHLYRECSHPALQAEREALQSTLPVLLEHLAVAPPSCARLSELKQCPRGQSSVYQICAIPPGPRNSSELPVVRRQGNYLPSRADLLPQLQMVHCLCQIFDQVTLAARSTSTSCRTNGCIPSPTTGSSGPRARSDASESHRCGQTPSVPLTPPVHNMMLLTAMMPTCQMLATHSLVALAARALMATQTMTLPSRRLSQS